MATSDNLEATLFKELSLPVICRKAGVYRLAFSTAALISVNALELILPLLIAAIIDSLTGIGTGAGASSAIWWASAYFFIAATQAGLRIFYRRSNATMNVSTAAYLRGEIVSSLLRSEQQPGLKPPSESVSSGMFTTRLYSDCDSVSGVFENGLISFIDAAFFLIFVPVAAIWLAGFQVLWILAPLAFVPLIVAIHRKLIKARFLAVQGVADQLHNEQQTGIACATFLRVTRLLNPLLSRANNQASSLCHRQIALARAEVQQSTLIDAASGISLVLLIWIGGEWVLQGVASIGTLVALYRYQQQLAWPLLAVGSTAATLQKMLGALGRINTLRRSLELDSCAEQSNLSDIKLPPAGKIAVLGENGSGKSRYLNSLYRKSGTNEAAGLLAAYLGQEQSLFGRSIAENIRYCRGGEGATDAQIDAACEAAGLGPEFRSNELKLDAELNFAAANISGGQRRRIELARLFLEIELNKPKTIIVDDPFASLDANSASQVSQSLNSFKDRSTLVVSGHRLAVVREADRVLVFASGAMLEEGTQAELQDKPESWYNKFLRAERLREELGERE